MPDFNMENDPTGENAAAQAAAFAQLNEAASRAATNQAGSPAHDTAATPQLIPGYPESGISQEQAGALAAYHAPGGGMTSSAPQTTTQGVGFDPGQPAPEGTPGPAPVGPQTPQLDYGQALEIAKNSATGTGPIMTARNLWAKKQLDAGNEKNAELIRGIGDRSAALGESQGKAHDDIAMRGMLADMDIERLNKENAKKDQEQADRQAKFTAGMEKGRQEYLDAAKNFNPDRLLGNAGRRVAWTIATAMGALGSAFLRQNGNGALDIINHALDRDMEQQKVQIGAKRENLSLMHQQLADMRATGADDHAARLAVKANTLEGLARYTDTRLQSLQGEEGRVAGANLRDQLYMEADKAKLQALAISAKPSGGRPKTPAQIVEEAQKLQKENASIRAQEVATQAVELKAQGKGADGTPEAALNRRTKAAQQISGAEDALKRVDKLIDMVKSGKVGTYNAAAPSALRSDAGDKFTDEINAIKDATARNYGGPVTASDREIAQSRWSPTKLTDSGLLKHLQNMREMQMGDLDRVRNGVLADDLQAIDAQRPKTRAKPTASQIAERLGTK